MKIDILIVGAGIVGMSTAYHLSEKYPDKKIVVLEKENEVAKHQTGHNSGVIHSGIYYTPGSFKAKFARNGSNSMYEFCDMHNIKYDRCGKVVVATDESELVRMNNLYQRGLENGLDIKLLTKEEVKEIEPHVNAVGGIHVRNTGIVDYTDVTNKLKELFIKNGGKVIFDAGVRKMFKDDQGLFIYTKNQMFKTEFLINCAGLYSDHIAKLSGIDTDIKIIPFRGEYFVVDPENEYLVNTLIYPVPNPELPFLGVHFTNMIHGGVDVGPNAVLGFKKEAYGKIGFDLKETTEILTFSGLYKMGVKNIKEGFREYYRSFNKRAFVKNAQKLIPEITGDMLTPMEAGVRAQAMKSDGTLIDDFYFESNDYSLHVLNAPSPAATCAIEIGKEITNRYAHVSNLI